MSELQVIESSLVLNFKPASTQWLKIRIGFITNNLYDIIFFKTQAHEFNVQVAVKKGIAHTPYSLFFHDSSNHNRWIKNELQNKRRHKS